ncbi:MAG: hypothetical protein JF606_04965 [Burkholderiales bacterium]|jgi:ABC-2 type transport system permease protein|nr:hypothetical protein [Burkholderiales bacterium]
MSAAVGTARWLLRHEMRVAWRGVAGKRLWIVALGGGALWMCIHVFAYIAVSSLNLTHLPSWVAPAAGSLLWLAIMLMLSHAIMMSVSALFDRGDLDLLLSSPLSARTVFIVRGLGITLSCAALYAFLLLPFANVGLFTGRSRLLAIYPTLASLALLCTSLGMLLTLTLVRTLGARRARTVAQIIGALAGASIFLVTQAQNMASPAMRVRVAGLLGQWMHDGELLAPDGALWFPFRAAIGEPLPLVAVILLGAGSFWLVMNIAYRRFLSGTQEAVAGSAKRKAALNAAPMRFRSGIWLVVLMKEWKLILRDPNLIAQTLLQTLYLIPLVFVVFRREEMLTLAVPSAVLLAGTLSGTLAWITVSAEDAPELIGVAPISLARIRWMKVVAAVLPVWLLVSPLLIYLLVKSLPLSVVFVLCLAGSTLSAGLTQIWYPRQGDRKNMKKPVESGKVMGFLEGLCGMGWAGVAWCLVSAPIYTPLPLVFAIFVPIAAWFLGRERREQGLLV